MQRDHVLKKLNSYLFDPIPLASWGGGRSEGRSLDALSFDMQHYHVLKKLSFNLLTPRVGGEGSVGKNSK